MKAPQDRKTPYNFDNDYQLVRVEANDDRISIKSRTVDEGSFKEKMRMDRVEAERMRDILDAWVQVYDERNGGEE